jgi:hypothetical protein
MYILTHEQIKSTYQLKQSNYVYLGKDYSFYHYLYVSSKLIKMESVFVEVREYVGCLLELDSWIDTFLQTFITHIHNFVRTFSPS